MPDTIPSLWSDDIKVDVVTPLAILRAQLEPLYRMTKGLLRAEISSDELPNDTVEHAFELIAPALSNYRYKVLSANHHHNRVYPVGVEAECFESTSIPERLAHTQEEFIEIIGEVLHSGEIRSVIHSLLARSNEERIRPSKSADSDFSHVESE